MSGFEMPDNNSPKNYPTGSYIGICLLCASSFMGPKMSRICAECTQKSKGDEDGKGD